MPRKTPKHVLKLIAAYVAYCDHVDEIIRVKATVPVARQADHVKKPIEIYIARLEGYYSLLESAMHDAKCYRGFVYAGPVKNHERRTHLSTSDPEFADWRRHYFTN